MFISKPYHLHLVLIVGLAVMFLSAQGQVNPKLAEIPQYKSEDVDNYFGTMVPDPYRWMESINSDSVKEWLMMEKALTQSEEAKFKSDARNAAAEIDEYQYVHFNYPQKEGPYFFHFAYTNYVDAPTLFYSYTFDGSHYIACTPSQFEFMKAPAIRDYSLSQDAKHLAVSLSEAGSDWQTIRVVGMQTRYQTRDIIKWVKFSPIRWWRDGFFYSRYDQPPIGEVHTAENTGQQLCYHKLGDKQEKDQVIYIIPAKADFHFHFDITPSNNYLIIYSIAKTGTKWNYYVAYKDLQAGVFDQFKPIIIESTDSTWGDYKVIDFIKDKFVVSTTRGATTGRVLLFDKSSTNKAELLIPGFKEVLTDVRHVGGKLLCVYKDTAKYTLAISDSSGNIEMKLLFASGIEVGGFLGNATDTQVFFYQTGFYCPLMVSKLNLAQNKIEPCEETKVRFDVSKYITEMVSYKSKDGTNIPMYLTHRKDLSMKGNHPVLLYGYGGFSVNMTPSYDYKNIILFDNDGILAVPLIRGGGEFGEKWHTEGCRLKKQNSFDDFIAAAEYLIDSGYTTKEHLAITGASNGGLLVGAMLTQRPDLFSVALADVGVYDMLRYQHFTAGKYIRNEYGLSSNPVDFSNLFKYSPLHNLKEGVDYPATLVITSENDDRVPPLHSYKFLATMQQLSSGYRPHILYFQKDQGHHGAENLMDDTNKDAFQLAFMFKQFNLPLKTRVKF